MRHRKTGRRLDMDSSQRLALFKNMVTSLVLHGTIRTPLGRAKELRRFAERVISVGKRAPLLEGLEGESLRQAKAKRVHAIRRARIWVNDDVALGKLFGELAERFRARPGGYTRIIRADRRPGDNAPMAYVQLVEAYDPAEAERRRNERHAVDVAAPDAEESAAP